MLRALGFVALGITFVVLAVSAGLAAYGYHVMRAALPALEGRVTVAGLGGPATVARDAGGVPVIRAGSRADLARALGFVHAQERFFQMDLLRRAGSGELAALVGAAALPVDRARRLHRFRARAEAIVGAMPAADRALLAAYAAGVNAGLGALGHAPWEYALLRVTPAPWREADTVLVVFAMYFDLQASDPGAQLQRAAAVAALGPDLTALLFPAATAEDAPIDGSMIAEPPIPAALRPAAGPAPAPGPPPHGSNNFAVGGALTASGGAMLETDMHLALRVPNIWYHARLVVPGQTDLVGVTLPGVPFLVAGSNGHIAWGFTDSYAETGDAVTLDMLPGSPARYATPSGPRPVEAHDETICAAHGACETLRVADTIWGPIAGQDAEGRPVAWRWVAHDPNAVRMGGFAGLERAPDLAAGIAAAHDAGMPAQNALIVDAGGHLGWTIAGQVPARHGLGDGVPHSWADGAHGWDGTLPGARVPAVTDPPDHRLWSANARVVGGEMLALLGDGGYAWGARAQKIRDDLRARDRFAETDLLAIATDAEASVLVPWQKLMLDALAAQAGRPDLAAMRPFVEAWGGRAVPASVGYWLVRNFEARATRLIYAGLTGDVARRLGGRVELPGTAPAVALRLLTARPAAVPAPYGSWDALEAAALEGVRAAAAATSGGLAGHSWGLLNRVGIHHPLAAALPGLGWLTDPPDVPVAGDTLVPRVAVPGDGASERMVVSPGHETSGIFEMPVGESDNPLSPYYMAGQDAWVRGVPAPLLPQAARWTLTLGR